MNMPLGRIGFGPFVDLDSYNHYPIQHKKYEMNPPKETEYVYPGLMASLEQQFKVPADEPSDIPKVEPDCWAIITPSGQRIDIKNIEDLVHALGQMVRELAVKTS